MSTTKTTEKTNEKPQYVAVRNDESRMFTLSYMEDEVKTPLGNGVFLRDRPFVNISIYPGLNFVLKKDFERCVTPDESKDGSVAGYESLSVMDVENLPVSIAKSLVKSTNKRDLAIWKQIETRKPVLEAIAQALD
jgi:hypothetical protein